jgi:hypothetical protein
VERIHRSRRGRPATSCAVRIRSHAGFFSSTQFEMKTLRSRTRVGVTVPDPDVTLLMIVVTHDVWFRSFRDELSLNVKYFIKSQESHARFRRKYVGNVADGISQMRPAAYCKLQPCFFFGAMLGSCFSYCCCSVIFNFVQRSSSEDADRARRQAEASDARFRPNGSRHPRKTLVPNRVQINDHIRVVTGNGASPERAHDLGDSFIHLRSRHKHNVQSFAMAAFQSAYLTRCAWPYHQAKHRVTSNGLRTRSMW